MTTHLQAGRIEAPPRIETPEAAEALCVRLIETSAELIALLDRETGLLRTGKPQEIAGLHVRKSALSAGLARDMAALGDNAEFVRMAAPERIEALRMQHETFQRSLQANQDALAAMKSVAESLLRTVAAKAGERRGGPGTYGRDAAYGQAAPARPVAISLDRNL